MSKLWKRVLAYIIDMFIITLITQCLSGTTILNKNLDKYRKYSEKYSEITLNYLNFSTKLTKDYQDNKLDEKEYNNLVEKYPYYQYILDKYYQDNKLSKNNYEKLVVEINKDYEKNYQKYYYLIETNSQSEIIIYLIILILYFAIFNYITDGQTLGKKLMKLRIRNIDNKKVSITNYAIRSILIYQGINYITRLLGIILLSKKQYSEIMPIVHSLEYVLELVILATMIIRKDGRGLHDLICKTEVVPVNNKN